jgi:ATP-dependent DNA helicase RecQ
MLSRTVVTPFPALPPGAGSSVSEVQAGSAATTQATPEALLRRCGLSAFRPGQREVVQAALEGRDSLVVMPTGGGKSLCYQLPALANVGLVVVVSPLIALMADQRRRMEQAGVRVVMLASGMEEGHNARALREIADGKAQLVLAAPERFASRAFRDTLAQRKVGLFVVDEAHCVAEWGHDFRPDYLRLHGAIGALNGGTPDGGRPAVMAATATATPRVAEEIAARLGLRDWLAVRSGFDRPNLTFDVVGVEGKGAVGRKRALLIYALREAQARPAIVYCGTRKDSEDVTALLVEHGLAAVTYHAGMPAEARAASHDAFMEGRAEVVVATNAFGMGVDKPNVRTVAHWALPTSLEGYYQEAGRAGRDGLPARALLLAARYDLGRLIRFNTERNTTVDDVRGYVGGLRRTAENSHVQIGPGELDDRDRLLLSIAERAGAVVLEPGAGGSLIVELTGRGSPRAAYAAIKAAKDRGWESYRAIERFISNASICRRRQILDHFGDHEPCAPQGRCCDVCKADEALANALATGMPLASAARARRAAHVRVLGASSSEGRAAEPPAAHGDGRMDGLADAPPEPVDQAHFERLKAWRLERSEGKPAYTVASNAALEGIMRARPASLAELIAVKGIGPTFCERHGESLLQALHELASESRAHPRRATACSRRDDLSARASA